MSFSSGKNIQNNINLTEAQTLQNKTLDSTNTLNGTTLSGVSNENPARLDVKKDTLANLETYAATATDGQLVYATDVQVMYQIKDNSLTEVGSGSGEINYIVNSDAEADTSGYSTYADTADENPEDGTGGTANITFTRNTSSPLRGDADFLLTKDAVNRQGEGVAYDFLIDNADQGKILTISFDYDASSAGYTDDDIRVSVYDVTNSRLLLVNGRDLKGGKGTHYAQFQASPDSTSYRLMFHVSSTNASAYTVNIDRVIVGPREIAYGSFNTEPVIENGITIEGTTTNPTKGTVDTDQIVWNREGRYLVADYTYYQTASGTAGSGQYLFKLPNNLSADTDYVKLSTTVNTLQGDSRIGTASVSSGNGGTYGIGYVKMYNSTHFIIRIDSAVTETGTGSPATGDAIGSSIFPLSNTNSMYKINIRVPIQGWESRTQLIESLDGREIVVEGAGNNGTSITANVTNIDFTETRDTTSSFDGTTFTAPETGEYVVTGAVRFTTAVDTNVLAYVNGTALKIIGASITSNALKDFSGIVSLQKGEVLSLRLDVGATLNNITTQHHIHIQKIQSGIGSLIQSVDKVVYLRDEKSAGTNGGTFNAGAWQTRTLNVVEGDTDIVSLSSNQFTLQPGQYEITASAPSFGTGTHKAKLYNETDATNVIIGTSEGSSGSAGITSRSIVEGTFTINSAKTFTIRHRCTASNATDGFGLDANVGVNEVYTIVKIKKVR